MGKQTRLKTPAFFPLYECTTEIPTFLKDEQRVEISVSLLYDPTTANVLDLRPSCKKLNFCCTFVCMYLKKAFKCLLNT